jgi:general secretion pathway protein H
MSATHRRFVAGFTLLEIMVVLVLIGIITSFAVLSIGGGPGERLANEAQRLAALVELHQQEAILNGEPRGVRFNRAGYAILSLGEDGQWHPPAATDALIRYQLPVDILLELWIESRPAELVTAGQPPQVLLQTSGEATEFAVILSLTGEGQPDAPRYRVTGDPLGRLTMNAVSR